MGKRRRRHADLLAGIVQEADRDDLVETRLGLEFCRLFRAHGAPLQSQGMDRGGAQRVEIAGVGGAEIALGRHVKAAAIDDHPGKEGFEEPGPRFLVKPVLRVVHRKGAGSADDMADVVQQRGDDDCLGSAVPLRPRRFYDLVIEVAIVRPGPIQGDMVHPYLRRRDRLEEVIYPAPAPEHGPPDELRKVLEKTLGVPLFQEQAMRLAMEAARFTPDEADALRRAMATFRRRGTLGQLKEKMVGRMVARGYEPALAERCFRQIEGFGDYGFPESHAASFALLAYVSSWLKCHHPDVFACALLNAQPMGFYAPAQIVRDAREHGVPVRPVDVNASGWDNGLEEAADGGHALRLGLRQVGGLRREDATRIVDARHARYPDIGALQRRAGLSVAAIETLAAADAFRSTGADRRQALWQARALAKAPPLPLFEAAGRDGGGREPAVALPVMADGEQVVEDYRTLRLSLRAHPLSFLRARLARRGALAAEALAQSRDGERAATAGLVLVRQRPGSAKGVIFMTLEDETGVVNVVVWPNVLERYRPAVLGGRLALV